MPRNDEGEFELVLGNRQLLSGFFIVVILFGVFFTMGYIVGRHSSPAASASTSAPEPAPTGGSSPSTPAPGHAEVMPAEPAQKTEPEEKPGPVTATRPATAPAETPHSETRATETRPPETRPAEARAPETHAAAPSGSIAEPAPGSYLQVAAPKKTAAGGVVESLKNKGITALLAPGPNEDTVRVLVGPLDAASAGKTKADLEAAGFKPFPKKY